MAEVEAVYTGGVFKPLGKVDLADNQRVQLNFRPIPEADVRRWLDEVYERQQRIIERRGVFPDSTLDIAADRRR